MIMTMTMGRCLHWPVLSISLDLSSSLLLLEVDCSRRPHAIIANAVAHRPLWERCKRSMVVFGDECLGGLFQSNVARTTATKRKRQCRFLKPYHGHQAAALFVDNPIRVLGRRWHRLDRCSWLRRLQEVSGRGSDAGLGQESTRSVQKVS